MTWFRYRTLLIVNVALFLLFLVGMLLAGHAENNAFLVDHGRQVTTLWQYAVSPDFGQAVFENWESEFLQMGMYVVLTAYLVQKGSAESRPPDETIQADEDPALHQADADAPWPVRHGSALILLLYKNSLAICFTLLFVMSMWLHAVSGAVKYSEEQLAHGGRPATTLEFLGTPDFWFESLQNWQSEFLAVATIVAASIWFRQQRSPQSKPVHAPHSKTGV
jgi:hypothetical protein